MEIGVERVVVLRVLVDVDAAPAARAAAGWAGEPAEHHGTVDAGPAVEEGEAEVGHGVSGVAVRLEEGGIEAGGDLSGGAPEFEEHVRTEEKRGVCEGARTVLGGVNDCI